VKTNLLRALALVLLAVAGPAFAQGAYPNKQVRIVVPFPAADRPTCSAAWSARSCQPPGVNRSSSTTRRRGRQCRRRDRLSRRAGRLHAAVQSAASVAITQSLQDAAL